MKVYIYIALISCFSITSVFAEETFKLQDGSIVSGTIQNETDTEIEVLTKFGLVKINKSFLIKTQ